MSVIFAASEVGSARALIPVIDVFLQQEMSVHVIRRGYFASAQACFENYSIVECEGVDDIKKCLIRLQAAIVIFSVNVKDQHPLTVARAADSLGLPTFHVLDYWNAYSERMKLDGLSLFSPTYYAVPDEYAAIKAAQEGIESKTIQITGQPAFFDALDCLNEVKKQTKCPLAQKSKLDFNKKWIVFVSEPVSSDQGASLSENPNFRGYTEEQALSILLTALREFKHLYAVCVLAHPRQDLNKLNNLWHDLGGEQLGHIISGIRGRDLLPFVNGVAGMASTLLYESWMLGMPVISIQPGLLNNSLRMMEGKENVSFIDEYGSAVEKTRAWLENLAPSIELGAGKDACRHQNAPENIFHLVNSCLNNDEIQNVKKVDAN